MLNPALELYQIVHRDGRFSAVRSPHKHSLNLSFIDVALHVHSSQPVEEFTLYLEIRVQLVESLLKVRVSLEEFLVLFLRVLFGESLVLEVVAVVVGGHGPPFLLEFVGMDSLLGLERFLNIAGHFLVEVLQLLTEE